MREDSEIRIPLAGGVNCVNEDKWGGDIYLPQHENNVYDETMDTPSMGYLVGYINSISIPICIDTGAGKSLMSSETWRKINANGELELKPQHRGFEAVNGSRIHCLGSIIMRLMLMGEEKNYLGYFKFFIVETLSVDALLGVDEIYRHKIRLNANEGFACHDVIGRFMSNLIFKSPYDVGMVFLEEDITIRPNSSMWCKIGKTISMVEQTGVMEAGSIGGDILVPRAIISEAAATTVLTNTGVLPVSLSKGTYIASVYVNNTDCVGVLQGRDDMEKEEDEAYEMGISIEPDEMVDSCDFGLGDSDLSNDDIMKAKSLIHEY